MLYLIPPRRCLAVLILVFGVCSHSAVSLLAEGPLPDGQAVIRGPAGKSEIVITTTPRLAGAIHSLTWDGKEFIDSFDHGRQLQSASNFDAGSPKTDETYNPTEAGSSKDASGPTSSSRLLHLVATETALQTTSQMAFWLEPGQKSGGHPAKNTKVLSDHLLTKRVEIGIPGLTHVVRYDVTFSLPIGEPLKEAVFESLTGYMPQDFQKFWAFNPATQDLEPLSPGPGEQSFPVVLATEDGSHAMGIYCPPQTAHGAGPVGYGRFAFPDAKVVKWNSVFRITDHERGIAPGEYSFRHLVMVGDLAMVKAAMQQFHSPNPEQTAMVTVPAVTTPAEPSVDQGTPPSTTTGIPEGLVLRAQALLPPPAPNAEEKKKDPNPLEIRLDVTGVATNAVSYGMFKITQAVGEISAGTNHKGHNLRVVTPPPRPGRQRHNLTQQVIPIDRDVAVGDQPAGGLRLHGFLERPTLPLDNLRTLEGTVQLRTSEVSIQRKLEDVRSLIDMPTSDNDLWNAGFRVKTLKQGKEVAFFTHAKFQLGKLRAFDTEGQLIPGLVYSYGDQNGSPYQAISLADGKLPDKLTVEFTVYTNMKTVLVPFKFENVPIVAAP